MIFAQNVAKLKREGNFSNTELASFIGVSRSTVSRILSRRSVPNSQYIPTYNTVRRVADKLGVSSDDVHKYHLQVEVI